MSPFSSLRIFEAALCIVNGQGCSAISRSIGDHQFRVQIGNSSLDPFSQHLPLLCTDAAWKRGILHFAVKLIRFQKQRGTQWIGRLHLFKYGCKIAFRRQRRGAISNRTEMKIGNASGAVTTGSRTAI